MAMSAIGSKNTVSIGSFKLSAKDRSVITLISSGLESIAIAASNGSGMAK